MNRPAFTLVELLVVIAIIGLMSGVAIVSMSTSREKARIAAQQQYDTQISHSLGSEIIADWPLDEVSGTAISDSSGNGFNATFNGTVGAGSYVPGVYGNAVYLDGTTNYIRTSNSLSVTLNSFSASAWFKTTSGADQKIISADVSNHYLQTLSGNLRICTANVCAPVGSKKYNDGLWHFAVVTGDGTSTRGYVDGVLQVTQTANSSTITSTTFSIGATGGTFAQRFTGSIDEVRVYGAVLNASAIKKMYADGIANLSASSLVYNN